MLMYLLIGIIIELLIIGIRTIRGVASWEDFDKEVLLFVLIFGTINVLIWPVTVLAEVYNTIKGV